MRIKRNHSRHGTSGTGPFDNCAHDQLMTEMQTIKHAQREYRRSLNLCVVSAVKKTHFKNWRSPIADCRF
jgi:hypothetical protein